MTEEVQGATPASQEAAEQVERVETTEVSTEATAEQTQETTPETTEEKAKKEPWFQKRIGELTREKYESKRQAESAAQEAQQLREQLARAQQGEQVEQSAGDVQTLVHREAARLLAEQTFNEACNKVYAAGKAEFPDFDAALANLHLVGVGREFLELATTSDAGAKLIQHLGKDLDKAAQIAALPPLQMARELTKLEIELSKPQTKPVSNAPAPITPISGKSLSDSTKPSDSDSVEEWMRKRGAQLKR